MTVAGPAWLIHELPHPIASAWRTANVAQSPSPDACVGAVEVALRFLTAVLIAERRAAGLPLPKELSPQTHQRPSLGTWLQTLKTLAHSRQGLSLPDLEPWLGSLPPRGSHAKQDIDILIEDRNMLQHGGDLSPRQRLTLQQSVVAKSTTFLTSLSFLRQMHLVAPLDAGADTSAGRAVGVQLWRGAEPIPPRQSALWQGPLDLHAFYLVGSDGRALPLAPLLHFGSDKASSDHPFLWRGFARPKKGDPPLPPRIATRHDATQAAETPALDDLPQPTPSATLTLLPTSVHDARTSMDASPPAQRVTRPDSPRERAEPVPPSAPQPSPRTAPASRRVLAAGLLVGLGAIGGIAAVALMAPSSSHPPSAAEPTTGPPAPPPVAEPSEPCEPMHATLDGPWHFTTRVLWAHPDSSSAIGVQGFYTGSITPSAAAAAERRVAVSKLGYTQGSDRVDAPQDGTGDLRPSRTGPSFVGSVALRDRKTRKAGTPMRFRLLTFGGCLIGLWRHEGRDFERAGMRGTLVGLRKTEPKMATEGFEACVQTCAGDTSLDDEGTEGCLTHCACKLDNCANP